MRRLGLNSWMCFIVLFGILWVVGTAVSGDINPGDLRSPFQIKVKIAKKTFRINEPIAGTVTIKNIYPATLPALFKIQVFREGQHFSESITSVPAVPFGTTKFSFKSFGVPDFNYGPGSEGNWRINIIQQNTDPSSSQGVNLRVIAPAVKKGKRSSKK